MQANGIEIKTRRNIMNKKIYELKRLCYLKLQPTEINLVK